jgi:hypothetical protein
LLVDNSVIPNNTTSSNPLLGGRFYIRNALSGLYLRAGSNGTQCTQLSFSGIANFVWEVSLTPNQQFTIRNGQNLLSSPVSNDWNMNRVNVRNLQNPGLTEMWSITPHNGRHRIWLPAAGSPQRFMVSQNAEHNTGIVLHQHWWDWHGNDEWIFVPAGNGTSPPSSTFTGWHPNGSNWYYFRNGVMQTGFQTINASQYFFNTNGVMATGWAQVTTNNVNHWHFFNNTAPVTISTNPGDLGRMVTGWLQVANGDVYFLRTENNNPVGGGPRGAMIANTTVNIGNSNRAFNSAGVCSVNSRPRVFDVGIRRDITATGDLASTFTGSVRGAFLSTFNVVFTLNSGGHVVDNRLNGWRCPNYSANNHWCNRDVDEGNPQAPRPCGRDCTNNTASGGHHKSHTRLLHNFPSTDFPSQSTPFIIRAVGHRICSNDNGSHSGDIGGAAWHPTIHGPRRDTLVITNPPPLQPITPNLPLIIVNVSNLIQHELSHPNVKPATQKILHEILL